jgi:hypothetical protein
MTPEFNGAVRLYKSEQLPDELFFVPLNKGGPESESVLSCTVSERSSDGVSTELIDQEGIKWRMGPLTGRAEPAHKYLAHLGPYDWTPVDVRTCEPLDRSIVSRMAEVSLDDK